MPIPVPTSQLIGTFLEVFAYGIYVVILPQCLRVVWKKHSGRALFVYLLATSAATFILVTIHLVVDLIRAMVAFTANLDTAGYPTTYYAVVDTTLNKAKTGTLVSTTILADALLLYRTFIVCGRKYWVVFLPCILWLLDIALSIWYTWSTVEAKPGVSVLQSAVFARGKYFFAITLSLNLICSFLIAFRIWYTQSQINGRWFGGGRSNLNRTLSIVLESASIYSLVQIVLIAMSEVQSSVEFFFLNSMPPVIGSVFSYVVLRASIDRKNYALDTGSFLHHDTSFPPQLERPDRASLRPVSGVHVQLERMDNSVDHLGFLKSNEAETV